MTPPTRTARPALAAALAIAVLATLSLAACGSSNTATTTTSAAPTSTAAPSTTTAAPADKPAGAPPGGMPAMTPPPTPTHSNLAYATTSPAQVLDLWLPTGASGPTPLVIYIHGGAFKGGDKAMVGAKVEPLLAAGYAVASVNYRLSGEATFPAGPQDVKAAVRWLRANAATYNLDPNRFATWGESAGGNLAALVGTSGNQSSLLDDPALGNPDVSSAVQAVVDWYGPSDFLQMDTQAASGGGCATPEQHDPASSPESAYLGAAIQTVPDKAAQANPITYIPTNPKLPAFSIAHGDADCNVPYQQSVILADALGAAGATVELTILPGAAHMDPRFDSELLQPTIAWLGEVLKG